MHPMNVQEMDLCVDNIIICPFCSLLGTTFHTRMLVSLAPVVGACARHGMMKCQWYIRPIFRRVGRLQPPSLRVVSFSRRCSSIPRSGGVLPLGLEESSDSAPVWERIVLSIQDMLQNVDDTEALRRFCLLWRSHFPRTETTSLLSTLEKELLANHSDPQGTGERVPRDLYCLPVFVQALCSALRLCTLRAGPPSLQMTENVVSVNAAAHGLDEGLLSTVVDEIRAVIFYLARERLTHVWHAIHDHLPDEKLATECENGVNTTNDVVPTQAPSPIPSRDGERLSHMGVKLSAELLQHAIMLADTGGALLSVDPPVVLLPVVYQLLLPALGACEQLDSKRLGRLATAFAQCTDFDDPHVGQASISSADISVNDSDDRDENKSATTSAPATSEALKPVMTSYTVLSQMNALARATEVRMREVTTRLRSTPSQTNIEVVKLRLLSLKERKVAERKAAKHEGSVVNAEELLEDVAVLCCALASRRYMDDAFWSRVTEFTCLTIEITSTAEVPRDVRHILFSLYYVKQLTMYDRLMSVLVRRGMLREPVPPPSEVHEVMKKVRGKTAADFQQE
ncbi:hypothetical protein DPX39_070019400 [Trypanosoma brucei equiperdum]|uniref:Uncharacterized protein n=1 Tax=Trypanosoma brucei equiperdum TaxID=630700 RepID=A0A3L6L770_9TRYP|nr:hypothetical protein DPX39_070019400 [Trypanosoma brucei equiperdum]